jgi:hypothetical protein
MSKKKDKKTGKKSANDDDKEKFKEKNPELVEAGSDDLREIVTETVTKLLAEDVLEMDDKGKIDVKQPEFLKKKKKKSKN